MHRLPGERVSIGDPPIEVERLAAWTILRVAIHRMSVFLGTDEPAKEILALRDLYALFMDEAQPTWDLADHKGPIPATPDGMWRLPLPLALSYVDGWTDTINEPGTAVDKIIPPGPLRDGLNAELKAKRRKD